MIFVLHYLLFNAGLPAVIILIALFLQTYSDASLSEIGTLLMALPFVSILIKPLFGALADRHNAHRHYLMGSLAFMALGYGSLAVAPFFPEFIREHGRLVWYFDIVGIIVGYSAFGIIWSLGDALAVNGAQMAGVSWGFYRMWGVVSWGIVGIIVGQINEVSFLPKYVPAFFVLVACLLVEIVLLAFWPNKYFVMCGSLEAPAGHHLSSSVVSGDGGCACDTKAIVDSTGSGVQGAGLGHNKDPLHRMESMAEMEAQWPANRSLTGTMTAGTLGHAASPRMMGAVANIFMEDLGGTLKSSLRLGAKHKRMGLNEILNEHQNKMLANEQQQQGPRRQSTVALGRGTLRRMMGLGELGGGGSAPGAAAGQSASQTGTPVSTLGKAAALRAASAIGQANNLTLGDASTNQNEAPLTLAAANLNSVANTNTAGVQDTIGAQKQQHQLAYPPDDPECGKGPAVFGDELQQQQQQQTSAAKKSSEDLQLVLLKLIIMRDKTIGKYMVLFTLFGFLLTCHLSYFYLHLERLCREKGNDFSTVMGGMLATHSISEVLSFITVSRYINRVGRIGGLLTCALAYFVRFAYYGTYFVDNSPYTGVPFEFCHGIAYGIVYTLITDIACECVDQVDEFLPELIERGLVEPDIQLTRLKSALRATMQGVFSGAFDGLGNGLGALFGGVFLDAYSFTSLWQFCALVSVAIMVIYPMTEWRAIVSSSKGGKSSSSKRSRPASSSRPPLPTPLATIDEKPKLTTPASGH